MSESGASFSVRPAFACDYNFDEPFYGAPGYHRDVSKCIESCGPNIFWPFPTADFGTMDKCLPLFQKRWRYAGGYDGYTWDFGRNYKPKLYYDDDIELENCVNSYRFTSLPRSFGDVYASPFTVMVAAITFSLLIRSFIFKVKNAEKSGSGGGDRPFRKKLVDLVYFVEASIQTFLFLYVFYSTLDVLMDRLNCFVAFSTG